jgi:imidazolonepropionase-like amidohydrolase/Tol biopolymer transport system component
MSAWTTRVAIGVLAGVVIGGVAGCQQDVPSTDEQAADGAAAEAVSSVVLREVNVTLTQGTNMAVTVNGAGDRVISLQGQLFLLPASGADAVAITDAYHDAREPQLGSDGTSVIFHGYRGGNWDIWKTDTAGAVPQALTDDVFDDREPSYSPDMSQVLFASDRGGSYDIWQLEVGSGELTQRTETEGNAYAPSVSPAGDLAYAVTHQGNSTLYTIGSDAVPTALVSHRGTISGVQWSPDGSQLSYQLLGPEGAQMRRIAAEGGEAVVLSEAQDDVFPFRASWLSADSLAYTVNGNVVRQSLAGQAEIWPFAVDLTLTRHDYQRRQRDYDPERIRAAKGISMPTISADGEHIYFSALGDLWHWQPAINRIEALTDNAAAEFGLALDAQGQRLAFVTDEGGKLSLRSLDLASGSVESLPIDANQISMPSWSPDGNAIAYFVDVPGNPLGGQLTVMNLATGETQQVLSPMPAQSISWTQDGARVAVTRLNPYSSRYREGVYELVVADWQSGGNHTVLPVSHVSMTDVVLTADGGGMTYVQAGYLHRLELDEDQQALEQGGQITQELTDMPRWSSNGEHLVYLNGAQLKYMNRASGEVTDVTPTLPWRMVAPEERYVVRAGRVFTGNGSDYLVNQDIVVQGSKILRMGPSDAAVTPDVDASMQTVVPGLFEMHAHMGETSEIQGRAWLSYGITSVRDPGSNPYVAKERQEAWDAGRRMGPRTHITGYLTDGNRVYYSMAEGIVNDDHLALALQRAADLELDFIKTYVRLPDHQQKQVVDFAHNIGIPVSSHELYPAVAHGMDHVEHIGGTSRRGYAPKVSRLGNSYQDVIELLSAGGMGITATAVLPGLAVIIAEEPDWFETPQFSTFYGDDVRQGYEIMIKRFGSAAASTAVANGKLLKALDERDALLVTGTDSPFSPYGAGLHAEFRLYARAGVTPARILHMATMKSAQAAGVADELGSIEAGKFADLVIVDGDPLADIRDLDRVVMTIKHGQRYPLETLLGE